MLDLPEPANSRPSHIVGIGASAGGLEALERLFDATPSDSGLAFVVVQHLSPDFKSLMDELLARWTSLPIYSAEDGMSVSADAIYLMPPKKEMILSEGKLLLTDKGPASELALPIDQFFRSLAREAGPRAIAVVLSGTGSDGSRGIREVHAAGGLVVVQREETAKFDGMPKSAMGTGIVDLELAPEEIPGAILQHVHDPRGAVVEESSDAEADGMTAIFRLLRQSYGIDFSYYKPGTVLRRTERRLQLSEVADLQSYVRRLQGDRGELDALYRDLLICVTGFFRDADAFATLEQEVLPELLRNLPPGEEFRAWVAGCATGEEAYSLAMLIHEQMELSGRRHNAKVFATDVHPASLQAAAQGTYPRKSVAGVSPERLERYFTNTTDAYQVSAELRSMVVFAPHDIVKDAPFTRLDLVSCRNLLIYLQPAAQKKAMCLFHFGLKTGGVLMLGASENPGELAEEFDVLEEHWKLFRKRRDTGLPTDMRLPFSAGYGARPRGERADVAPGDDRQQIEFFLSLLEQAFPAGIVVNRNRQLVHCFGDAANFLQLRSGRPSLDVLDLLHDELKLAVSGAMHRAARQRKKVVLQGVRSPLAGDPQRLVNVSATPISTASGEKYTLIAFENAECPKPLPSSPSRLDVAEATRDRVESLEAELQDAKESLQATIEELETSNEQLQSTNQEMLAANEELQSTNEELHSVNEELYTVNAEFQTKIKELTELTNDMDNLLLSTEVHTIFLDESLCIRKFTPNMGAVFHLISADIGRRIDGFVHTIDCHDLQGKLARVLDDGVTHEEEVRNKAGVQFLMRILPYRGDKDRSGVVMTLVNITSLRQAEARFRNAVEAAPSGMLMINRQGRITLANSEMERLFGYAQNELLGLPLETLIPQRHRQQHVTHRERYFQDPQLRPKAIGLDLHGLRKNGEEFPVDVRLSPIDTAEGTSVLAGIVDVTDRKRLESSLRNQVVQRDRFLATLSHELRNPMAAIFTAASMLDRQAEQWPQIAQPVGVIRRQAAQLAGLLDDLLDVSRVTQDKIRLHRQVTDLTLLSKEAIEAVGPLLVTHRHAVHLEISDDPLWVDVDRGRILQVMENLLTNAIKYTPDNGNIWLTLDHAGNQAEIRVRDDGSGISAHLLRSIFDMFVQSDDTLDRSDGGMGVGLTLVRSLVELHQGAIEAFSDGLDQGSEFVVRLPLVAAPAEQPGPQTINHEPADLRLVLVEDSDDAREMLGALLEMDGYQVQTAADGRQGLELILASKPEVALVDIGLPILDGYQVACGVRERYDQHEVLLIALTGYGTEEDHESVLEAGFDLHLVKPVNLADLKSAIGRSARRALK